MEVQLEWSTTWNHLAFHFLKINPWRFMQLSGMLMTGQHKVGVWRLTGAMLLSLPPTETSTSMLALGHKDHHHHLALHLPIPQHGRTKGLMLQAGTGFDGCNASSWSMTTALTVLSSRKVSHVNASIRGSRFLLERPPDAKWSKLAL